METDPFTLTALGDDTFLSLGTDEIVYIKPIEIDGVRGWASIRPMARHSRPPLR